MESALGHFVCSMPFFRLELKVFFGLKLVQIYIILYLIFIKYSVIFNVVVYLIEEGVVR